MEYFKNIAQLSQWIDSSKWLEVPTCMFSPIRFYVGTAFAEGDYILFDRNVAQTNLWGSGIVPVLGGIIEDWDFPEWLITPNRSMPDSRKYLAEYLTLDWRPTVITNAAPFTQISQSFALDKMRITQRPMYIDFRPDDKDINMRVPLSDIGDYNSTVYREITGQTAAAVPINLNNAEKTRLDEYAGMYPLFNRRMDVPGMFFDSNRTINIKLINKVALPAGQIAEQIQMLVKFKGYMYRPL